MKKKKTVSETMDHLCNEIKVEVRQWKYIKLHGCRDPFWPDGSNMNLTRNHILYYKAQIKELCKENNMEFPAEYYIPTPPEVDNNYMARNLEFPDRLKRIFANTKEKPVRSAADYNSDQLMLF